MKYEVNEGFIKVIESVGWKEILTKENFNDRKRGKRYFKKSLNSKGVIYLDRERIKFSYGFNFWFFSRLEVKEIEFISFINYCSNTNLRQKLKRKNFQLEQNCFEKLIDDYKRQIESYSKYETGRKYVKNLQKIMDELTKPIHPL
mgnify:FL=1